MPVLRRAHRVFSLPLVLAGCSVAACGSPPPAATVAAKPAPAAASKEKPIDVSPVPAPPGLVVLGRVNKPDAIVSAVGAWTRLPLPSGADLVRSIADDAVAAVVDLSQPIDAAVTVGLSRRGVDPVYAFSVAVKSYDQARAKLGESHRLIAGENGQYKVEGLGKRRPPRAAIAPGGRGSSGPDDDEDDDSDGDGEGCVLAPAAEGARLVCGESAALESLVPYLSRTMPRERWTSDVHVEVRPEPVRAPLQELRASLPILARSLLGSQSPAVRELVDASLGEVMDIVNDAQKLTVDAQIADTGLVATTRFELQSTSSVFARLLTTDRGDAPPAAFWRLPGETDLAFFGRGSDPKLLDHPRELLANLMLEATSSFGLPDAEQKAIKDLVADRMLALFTSGPGVYGKGVDQAALDKAFAHLKTVKPTDLAGEAEARLRLGTQIVGWHLYQVNEPIAKVGPILKDWPVLWNRPAFAKWAKTMSTAPTLPRMRIAPVPAGVTLPKETVHLEITIPREDIVDYGAGPSAMAVPPPPGSLDSGLRAPAKRGSAPVAKPPAPKKIALKPAVVHVFAIPDGAATWLGVGLDAKLVAEKAAASLASAPDAKSLGKAAGMEALREGKVNSGGFATLRGLMVVTALTNDPERSPFSSIPSLPHKGLVPFVFTGRAEGPSASARAGSSVGSLRVSRAVIEDIVKLVMSH
ncbi:MAG: hypothetical protein KF795_03155 [Labilithrix sp.]|nr:hypothetical protein [Labilithrix sp.]